MLLEFDVAGAEWFVVAFLCRDPNMIGVYKSGKSPHIVTGARLSGLPEELVAADEKLVGKTIDEHEIFRLRREKLPAVLDATYLPRKLSIRQAAKKCNHALNYDESYLMFALMNEIDNAEANTLVNRYKNVVYPELPKWHASIRKQITDTRMLTNCFGQKFYFMGALDKDTFKAAYSCLPQSTVVTITNQAMSKIFLDESPDFAPAQQLAQVHDSLLFQYMNDDYEAAARFAVRVGTDYMAPTLNYGEPFKLGITMKAAYKSWGKVEELGAVTPDVDLIAKRIRETVEKQKEAYAAAKNAKAA